MHNVEREPSRHTALDSLGDAAAMTAAALVVVLFAMVAAQPLLFLGMLL